MSSPPRRSYENDPLSKSEPLSQSDDCRSVPFAAGRARDLAPVQFGRHLMSRQIGKLRRRMPRPLG